MNCAHFAIRAKLKPRSRGPNGAGLGAMAVHGAGGLALRTLLRDSAGSGDPALLWRVPRDSSGVMGDETSDG